jgi:CDGSH-type Zn-finger protein
VNTRKDAPVGEAGKAGKAGEVGELVEAPAPVTVRAMRNGPLMIRGACRLLDSGGGVLPSGAEHGGRDLVLLCRCGHSANKPFCDGSHKTVGFQG